MADSSNEKDGFEFVAADDGDALQDLFSKICDKEGLMTKEAVKKVPSIAQLLEDKDLLMDEFDDIWDAAPKFPEVEPAMSESERIDVDSFIQIYRDIDDLFEDDDDDNDNNDKGNTTPNAKEGESSNQSNNNDKDIASNTKKEEGAKVNDQADTDVSNDDEEELKITFQSLCDSSNLISKSDLRGWDEIEQLISSGMLGEDEFDILWDRTSKSPGSSTLLDVDGFLSFNVALDDLFVFDEEDDDVVDDDDYDEIENTSSIPDSNTPNDTNQNKMIVVDDDDLPPGVIFSQLADNDFLIGVDDLDRWGSLVSIIESGDILPLEVQNIFESIPKAPGTTDKLNEDGFIALYEAIDALFEEVDEDGDDDDNTTVVTQKPPSKKKELIDMIARLEQDEELLPCGLESSDREQAQVLEIVSSLENESQNICISKGGNIQMEDLAGTWELCYTSSSMMRFNKGLTGLGGSFPNGKFAGLRQKLVATKYITDVEYIERIEVTPETSSFDATVTGDWELKNSVSLFTGEPSTIMSIEPDKVTYGPTSTRADHWKSVRSMNLLDLSYLDNDLRIMRGNTSTDTLFIFKRCA